MKIAVSFLRLAPLLVLFTLVAFVAPVPKLKKTPVGKDITLGVPEGFTPLPDDGIAAKYPSPRKPLAVFSNPNSRVDVSVAQKPSTFTNSDYALLLKVYKASIQNTYSKVEFLTEEVRTINKRDFVVLEFTATLNDNRRNSNLAPIRRYQFIQYTIKGDQLYVFTFNAPADEQPQWQPTARAVMESVSMK